MKPSTKIFVGAGAAAALAIAFLVFVLPPLAAWLDRKATGLQSHDTATFTTLAPRAEAARERGEFAEAFVSGMTARWGASRGFLRPSIRVKIFVFPTHDALSSYGLFKHGQSLEFNGGYWSRAESAIALVGADDATLRHELTHMLVSVSWPNDEVDPWFSEGLAQWHEGGAEGSLPPGAAASVAEWIASGRVVPLERLVAATSADFATAGNEVFYRQSVTLLGWLATDRPAAFERVLRRERGDPGERGLSFEAAAGGTWPELEAGWREWTLRMAR